MRQSLAAAFAALALILPFAPAAAFDSGPHAGITVDAVMRARFNRSAADTVQVENWLTDYYTWSPTLGSRAAQCDIEKLHFDDVFSTADVGNYWSTLLANTKDAVKAAEQHNDVVEFYTVLGMSLHMVQDFYAYSNWVEQTGASWPTACGAGSMRRPRPVRSSPAGTRTASTSRRATTFRTAATHRG